MKFIVYVATLIFLLSQSFGQKMLLTKCEDIIANNSTQLNKIADIALDKYNKGEYLDAIKLFECIILEQERKNPTEPAEYEYYYNLGTAYLALGKFENAFKLFTKASNSLNFWKKEAATTNISYNEFNLFFNRGLAYSQLFMETEAIEDFTKSINLAKNNDNFYKAYNARAISYLFLNDCNKAAEDFRKALSYIENEKNKTGESERFVLTSKYLFDTYKCEKLIDTIKIDNSTLSSSNYWLTCVGQGFCTNSMILPFSSKAATDIFTRYYEDIWKKAKEDKYILFTDNLIETNNWFAEKSSIMNRISTIQKNSNDSEAVIFYFNLHGNEIGICLGNEQILYNNLFAEINKIKAKYRIVILESCYSGKSIGYNNDPRTLIITSSNEFSFHDNELQSSFFTDALHRIMLPSNLKKIDLNGDNKISYFELFQSLRMKAEFYVKNFIMFIPILNGKINDNNFYEFMPMINDKVLAERIILFNLKN